MEIVIRPRRGWEFVDLRECWQYRELLWILALRDIKVRYKQTAVGVAWAVLQPLMMMVVFTGLFTLLGRFPAGGDVPYAITLYCAMLPWQLFASSLAHSGESLVGNRHLITRVYFPRVIVPVAPVVSGLVDFGIAFLLLLAMMGGYGAAGHAIAPTYAVAALPLFLLLAVAASLALGLWLSALNALYRDFRYVLPFLIQIGLIASPVLYDLEFLSARVLERGWSPVWISLYALNPMVGVLEGFRWALLGGPPPPAIPMIVSSLAVVFLMIGGLAWFRRMERHFADRV